MRKLPPVGAENKRFNSRRVGVNPWLLLDLLSMEWENDSSLVGMDSFCFYLSFEEALTFSRQDQRC